MGLSKMLRKSYFWLLNRAPIVRSLAGIAHVFINNVGTQFVRKSFFELNMDQINSFWPTISCIILRFLFQNYDFHSCGSQKPEISTGRLGSAWNRQKFLPYTFSQKNFLSLLSLGQIWFSKLSEKSDHELRVWNSWAFGFMGSTWSSMVLYFRFFFVLIRARIFCRGTLRRQK